MIKKIKAFALLFSFIYQISYIFLPFNVPFVMGLIGMPIYLYKNFTFPLEDRKYVKDILLSLLPVAIVISDARLKALVKDKTTPKTRNEREIAGYRDVLNTIHERVLVGGKIYLLILIQNRRFYGAVTHMKGQLLWQRAFNKMKD